MRPIRRILVAVKSPSERSQPAIAKAVQLAQGLDAKLELFHALTASIYIGPSGTLAMNAAAVERERHDACLRRLEEIATRLRKQHVTVSAAAEWDYPAHEAIVRRAAAIKADLIVAARHGTKHRLAWLLSFTDWELLRVSPVPVLLVKSSRRYRHPIVLAAIDPTHADKPATLDSEILRVGAAIAEPLHGELHAVHAFAMPLGLMADIEAHPTAAARIEREFARGARLRFDRILRSIGIGRSARHLVSGDPVCAIDTTARQVASAIVILGTISRSGLKRALIGNTAERALDRLRCDVLIVKPPKFKASIPARRSGIRVVTAALPPP